MKKIRSFICFLLIFVILRNQIILGEDIESSENLQRIMGNGGGVDVMFGIDFSNSMVQKEYMIF